MKYNFTFILMIVLFILACQKEKGVPVNRSKDKQEISPKKEVQVIREEKKSPLVNRQKKTSSGDEFFKGGFKTTGDRKMGVYLVDTGDSIWVIAEKYVRDYKKMSNYTKKDIGNAAYRINLANYRGMKGGVNDDLKWGDKVLIPLD